MDVWQLLRLAVRALLANTFRAALTMLGLVIGVSAVITVMAVGGGGRAMISQEILKYGALDGISIQRNWRDDHTQGITTRISLEDIVAVREHFPQLRNVTPFTYFSRDEHKVRFQDKEGSNVEAQGNEGEAARILNNTQVLVGRYLSEDDALARSMVCVIDETLRDQLFDTGESVLGKELTFGANYLTIVGLVKTPKGLVAMMGEDGGRLIMPYTVAMMIDGETQFIDSLGAQVNDLSVKNDVSDKLISFLKLRHAGRGNYRMQALESLVSMFNSITGVMAAVISSVAAISLLVGGIGIMNIMLVSVTERTKEIGLRKAIGARRRDILGQFLCEAVVLSVCGGVIGIAVGLGISSLGTLIIHAVMPDLAFSLPIDWTGILMASGISVAIGIFFGYYPAYRASKLSPIEALRTE
ncbi:MAG: ABC transporter permease [Candidatus Sericytochromatia bacterium]|nr:ABC transporter permease [Candidatus Sericytochromatia bacterium]